MNFFKKFGVLTLLLVLAAMVMSACGDTATSAATTAAATTAAATTTSAAATTTSAATSAAATTTSAAATSAAATTTSAAAGGSNGKVLKIGLVTDIGQINDKSFNESAWNGVLQAQKELGAQVKYIETKSQNDYATNINQFVSANYDVIVTVGFLMQDATTAAAKANPNIKFIGVDQAYDNTAPSNLAGLVFQEDKSGFLAGAVAAGMSKTHKVAAVLGTKSVPAVARYGEGYQAGAAYLSKTFPDLTGNQSTDVKLVYHADGDNAFSDPAWGAEQAKSLIQAGYDIIFGAGGKTGNGAIEAAADQGNYIVGVDDDQYLTLASEDPHVDGEILTSAMKLITPGLFGILKSVQDGSFKGGGNITGPVGVAPYHDLDSKIPQNLKDAINKINSGLQDGSIKTGVNIQ